MPGLMATGEHSDRLGQGGEPPKTPALHSSSNPPFHSPSTSSRCVQAARIQISVPNFLLGQLLRLEPAMLQYALRAPRVSCVGQCCDSSCEAIFSTRSRAEPKFCSAGAPLVAPQASVVLVFSRRPRVAELKLGIILERTRTPEQYTAPTGPTAS